MRNALSSTPARPLLEGAYLAGIAATDWTWSVRLEDLDNDGRLDLFVTNGFPRDPGADLLRMMMADSPAERIRIMYESPPQAERTSPLATWGPAVRGREHGGGQPGRG
jgi:hypothetical protein